MTKKYTRISVAMYPLASNAPRLIPSFSKTISSLNFSYSKDGIPIVGKAIRPMAMRKKRYFIFDKPDT